MTNQLVERGYLTQSLSNASHSGEHGLKAVPGLLKLVLENRAWERRIIIETGEEFLGFPSFEAYIKANPPKGLGIDAETIDKLIDKNEDLRVDFYEALRRPNGGDRRSETAKENIRINIVNSVGTPAGNSKAYALQKLSDEGRVELLEQIKAGKLSANAAMKQAGFRRPRLAISLDDPVSAAKTLMKNTSPEFIEELKRLLQ